MTIGMTATFFVVVLGGVQLALMPFRRTLRRVLANHPDDLVVAITDLKTQRDSGTRVPATVPNTMLCTLVVAEDGL